jgi:hypothetical protein
MPRFATLFAASLLIYSATAVVAAEPAASATPAPTQPAREAALAEMLSGATLEGSFTVSSLASKDGGSGQNGTRLAREKYTLGEVKKLDGNLWLLPTRIQYGDKDLQIPITLPIEWAGDTPVVVVDNLGLPGLGTVSARVMFFADHYAGYWQHGDASGNLFGVIHRAPPKAATK